MQLSTFATVLFAFIHAANAGQPEPTPKVTEFLGIAYYNDCEGKYAANYTRVWQFDRDSDCSWQSGKATYTFDALVQCGHHEDHSAVNSLQTLGFSLYPTGAYSQAESLSLVTGGPLQGKYLYNKAIYLEPAYLKKCSSILGYSYVSSKSATLLIADKLDLNVLLSPTGGYEIFKKGCTTICHGVQYRF